jgi:hypothetical protein
LPEAAKDVYESDDIPDDRKAPDKVHHLAKPGEEASKTKAFPKLLGGDQEELAVQEPGVIDANVVGAEVGEALESFPSVKGFFFNFEKYLGKKDIKDVLEDIFEKDLLVKMKQFHQFKNEAAMPLLESKEIGKALHLKLAELRKLEDEWHFRRKELLKYERVCMQKEYEIESKAEELKRLMHEVSVAQLLNKKCDHKEAFKLEGGLTISSLNELLFALEDMDSRVFHSHVNSHKNDFATWIRHAFKNKELAHRVSKAKTRAEVIKALYSF